MKTAMQELIEYFNKRPEYDKTSEGYEIIEKAKQLLEKEKEQIRQSYIFGHYDSSMDIYNPSESYSQIINE